jgi:glucokinase
LLTFEQISQILVEAIAQTLNETKIECLLFGGQISRSFLYMEEKLKQLFEIVPSLKMISPVTSIENDVFWGTLALKP